MYSGLVLLSALAATASAQQACSVTPETHPPLTWSQCSAAGTCSNVQGSVTIDANWRWLHRKTDYTNCYTGSSWDTSICNNPTTCAQTCCYDGSDYSTTYGITTSGNALNLKFVTNTNYGSRTYLMASDTQYQTFTLLGNEFTFDVDASNLPCGLNGALYFVSMDADGGASKYSTNAAGAKFGTGYCDAQCPKDLKFINGQANLAFSKGSCCSEMDIWEANSMATAYTAHPCATVGQTMCDGAGCTSQCDSAGCDFNSYRQGNTSFYGPGPGFTIDTTKKVTVVTRFARAADGSASLGAIQRFYVQNGVVFANSQSNLAGAGGNSITQAFCDGKNVVFGDDPAFNQLGGLAQLGAAVSQPMVLVMSIWDDSAANMLWLDSTFPVGSSAPGAVRGSCPTNSGNPSYVRSTYPNSNVAFSNIRFGPIGSTINLGSTGTGTGTGTGGVSSSSSSAPPAQQQSCPALYSSYVAQCNAPSSSSSCVAAAAPAATTTTVTMTTTVTTTAAATAVAPAKPCSTLYGQCGGIGWTGATCCAAGTCVPQAGNPYYSQCLP